MPKNTKRKFWWLLIPGILIFLVVGIFLYGKYGGYFDRLALNYVEAGDNFEQRKLFGKAIQQYDFAISLEELDGIAAYQAYLNKADIYEQKNRDADAIIELNKAVLLRGDNVEAYNRLGEIYLRTGEYNLARQQYNEALALEGDNPEGLVGLARVLMGTGASTHEIKNNLLKAEKRGEESLAPQYYLGLMYLRFGGDLPEAQEKFAGIVESRDATNDYVHRARIALGRLDFASQNSEELADEGRAYESLLIAWIYIDLEEYDLAAREISQSISLLDDYRDAYLAGAYVQLKQKDYELAGEYSQKAIELDPLSGFGHYLYGKSLYLQDDTLNAETELLLALDFDFDNVDLHLTLARLYDQRDDASKARKYYLSAATKDQSASIDIIQEVVLFLLEHNSDLALEQISDFAETNPNIPRALALKALCQVRLEEYDLAAQTAEETLAMDATEPMAEYVLGQVAEVRGENADEHYKLAIDYDLEGAVTGMIK